MIHAYTVGGLQTSVNSGALPAPPTAGGNITIQASNLGLLGPLAAGESVIINLAIGGNVQCSNAEITANGIVCTVPAGVGRGNISVNICGKTSVYYDFRFAAPSITVLSGTFTQLIITGSNFGLPRTFDGVNDYVLIDNSPCNVTFVNDTVITCNTPTQLQNQMQYSFSVSIGGQVSTQKLPFQICFPGCRNNGICLATKLCSCVGTSFKGPTCETPVQCAPPCQNKGICILSSTTGQETCNCDATGFVGAACDINPKQDTVNTTIIIAVVVPVGVVLIVVGLVVAIFLAKREKREGANFIPLEKKDFTKIIYGDQLSQHSDKSSGSYKELEKLLVEDLKTAFAISSITQITEADKIAKAMVVVYQDNHKVLPLLEAFITEEVRTTESAGTLFRANSMVSKMFKFYSRLIGLPYLYITIGPELGKIIEEELGLEVDPEKMEEGKDLDEMRWALMSQSQKILKQILVSDDKCPTQFRQLFIHIANQVKTRFPDNVYTTIGGFIFLRLFCPAVSSPEAYGIVEEPPSADARRLLILITKVLQNLSNDVEFGSKEPYMTKMNDFIHSNRQKLIVFYEKLLKSPTKAPVTCDMPKNIKALNLGILAAHIKDNLAKIDDSGMRSKLDAAVNN